MVSAMGAIVVVTSVGTEEQANVIAREIIQRRHAACVNIIPGVRSIYRWQGKICKDGEMLLIIKTLEEEFEKVQETILELHSYDVPEILAFNVRRGDQDFIDWIGDCLDKEAEFSDEEDETLPFASDDDF